jgi:hypothetical protein
MERRIQATSRRARERLRRSVDSWAERTTARATGPGVGLIGLDVSRPPSRLRTRSWVPIVAAGVLGALLLAVLRVDVIRMRFALARSFEEQLALEERKRELTVEMRKLRDPAELARRAEALGFRRAEHLIDLEPLPAAPGGTDPDAGPDAVRARRIALAAAGERQAGTRP